MADTMLIVSAVGDRQQNRGEIPKSIGKVTLVDRPSVDAGVSLSNYIRLGCSPN